METRLFLVLDADTVVGHITAMHTDWSSVEQNPALVQVDADTYQTVVVGSTRLEDGTYAPPDA